MNTTGDVVDRSKNGRLARNLALSISGGALITLLGASAAHADDLSDSGTTSDGAGAARSGDATAVGNRSGSDTRQTGSASGALGGVQVTNQTAATGNVGVGVANTGGNTATGNSSDSSATGTQTALNLLGAATNSGSADNGSNGSAYISTGNASAVGNASTSNLTQDSRTAQGALGGIIVVSQNGAALNAGVALADSGQNTATGNDSTNDSILRQVASANAGLAANNGKARNDSDGKATISTGNAAAVGNESTTSLVQSGAGSSDGDLPGLVIIQQGALVANLGLADASTGDNDATGNVSVNDDDGIGTPEGAAVTQANPGDVPLVSGLVSNTGEASNTSDGRAAINTGNATAAGNHSSSVVDQGATSAVAGPGGLTSQLTSVLNAGFGSAGTGGNAAFGNRSDNDAAITQTHGGNVELVGSSAFQASASNASDGDAAVTTGDAWALGNSSTSDVSQDAVAKGDVFNVLPQVSGVQNLGLANAVTGGNTASGNWSGTASVAEQDVETPEGGDVFGPVALSNSATVAHASDGAASITTGTAKATGNTSSTHVDQVIDPTGLVIPSQVADVANVGVADANTGLNFDIGNNSFSPLWTSQFVDLGEGEEDVTVIGAVVGSNSLDMSVTTDGRADITTGDATASGNESTTGVGQTSDAAIGGIGFLVNTQAALVVNAGVAGADTGDNEAYGNDSGTTESLTVDQSADVVFEPGGPGFDTTVAAFQITGSNTLEASNTSDGTASIATGAASATGNDSDTAIDQTEGGSIDGAGFVINTQAAAVLNVGAAGAITGGNVATGNSAFSRAASSQSAQVGSQGQGDTLIAAPQVLASNTSTVGNASDGAASIDTGDASAVGNASSTQLDQVTNAEISGAGFALDTQVGVVANVGLAGANTGFNVAFGNDAESFSAEVRQSGEIGSGNDGDTQVLAALPLAATNTASATNSIDGAAEISTGDARATGNRSTTHVAQDPESSVAGLGGLLGTQVAGVANVGVAIADSGDNTATGNESTNDIDIVQAAEVGSDNLMGGGSVAINALGPVLASNTGTASNSSSGHAKVKTGNAVASGNASSTTVRQDLASSVDDSGIVIGTQVGGVANVGIAVAGTGSNIATGNESANRITPTPNIGGIDQVATISALTGDPSDINALGPVVASNSADASNSSDGEACVCTGDATASGNQSTTDLVQDLDLSTGGGLVLLTQAGGVLNLGIGLADSGDNDATGNSSESSANAEQTSNIDDALAGLPAVGPQIADNGITASNSSDGTAKVASGNATALGNDSTTTVTQEAEVDSALAIATITGGTTNAGLGVATSGDSSATGNDSINTAVLIQAADGSGLVANQGEVSNESDGTAIIGDPSKCDDVTETPVTPDLPRTGGPVEAEAAFGLMLLLSGFACRRSARRRLG